jgi:hypothetical protein
MSEKDNGPWPPDPEVYTRNRNRFTWEELQPYRGHWCAWSADGTRVVAHDADPHEVVRQIDAMGLGREAVVFSFQPDDDGDALL